VLLSIRDLHVTFPSGKARLHAVDGLDLDVDRGEVVALVGESGAGKSVAAASVLGLVSARAEVRAAGILWMGEDLLGASPDRMREVRGREIGMIFQEPLAALNPVHTVGRQVGEMARIHAGAGRREARARAVELLALVGIPQPDRRAGMYPHELSGGMRQRVMIAMAIACSPDLLIADEPTTALDVTVQAQVLELLLSIKDEIDSAILLITHDLGVVAGIADRVLVMYAGRAVELAGADDLFHDTRHPYTLGLLGSRPSMDDGGAGRLVPIAGAPPSLLDRPEGCAFHPRCPMAHAPGVCLDVDPPLRPIGGPGHLAACHFAEDLGAGS
jgi:oligopeptide/dipeptide ABC transporter ATP-binding protein